MASTQPIRDKKKVIELSEYYFNLGEMRNYVLIEVGLYTALRIGDILRITWDDVYDFEKERFLANLDITEEKTNKSKIVALHKNVINALTAYSYAAAPGMPLIINPDSGEAISRIQAYRLVRDAGIGINLDMRISCHTLRKTFGYHAWKDGVPPVVLMEIFNHSSYEITRRYLGVAQDDKNEVYLDTDYNDIAKMRVSN